MMGNKLRTKFRPIVAMILTTVAAAIISSNCGSLTNGQVLGIPTPKVGEGNWADVLAAFPDEQPVSLLAWGKAGQANPDGNPSEKWLATPELQKVFGKIKKLIIQSTEKGNDVPAIFWLKGPLWDLLENGGMVSLEAYDAEKNMITASFVSYPFDEGELERSFLSIDQSDRKEKKLGGDTVYLGRADNFGNALAYGVHGKYLIVATNEQQWSKTAARIDAGKRAPKWARKLFGKYPIRRLGGCGFVDIEKIKEILPTSGRLGEQMARPRQIIDQLGVDSLFSAYGTDEFSNVSTTHVEANSTGLLSSIDVEPIATDQIAEFSDDGLSAIGIKVSPENILDLVKTLAPEMRLEQTQPVQLLKQFQIDFESDLVGQLRGDLRLGVSGSVFKPSYVVSLGVKDKQAFQATFDKILAQVENTAGLMNAEFTNKTGRDGITVYSFKPQNGGGTGVFWALHESELLFGSNNRTIGSFIRKRNSLSNPLTKQPMVDAILSKGQPKDNLGLVTFQVADLDQIVDALLPMASLGLNFAPPEVREMFGPDDIPSPESLGGLRPSVSMVFRTQSGATMVSRYDTPISVESSSGVLVGMLLPAVQQVRVAARRTETLNNFRQIGLATLNYESRYRKFPTAFSVDDDGNPLLSWRVHILPFLGHDELYKKFHLDEPWDSPHNIKLLEEMPAVYQSVSQVLPPGHTMALVPVTSASVIAQGEEEGNRFENITDGSSNTILLLEGGLKNAVPWTAPRDLVMDDLNNTNFDLE